MPGRFHLPHVSNARFLSTVDWIRVRPLWNAGKSTHNEFGINRLRFYTPQECEEWLRGRKRRKPDAVPDTCTERVGYPQEPYRFFFVAHWIAASLTHRMPTLLWITEWGIWPS